MQATCKTFFAHTRRIVNDKISNLGGMTFAYQETENGVRYAIAKCSDRDNFSRKFGRTVAAGRLNSAKHSVLHENITLAEFRKLIPR